MIKIFIVIILLGLASCSSPPPPTPERSPNVLVAHPRIEDVPITIEAIGNIYASLTVQVKPQITGKLIAVHVEYGQYVNKGDPLFTIDPRPYQAALMRAKANLSKDQAGVKFAEQRLERYSQLVKDRYVSELTLEQYQNELAIAKAQVDADQADVDQAQVNLDYCFIKAPFDGRLGNLPIDPGNLVSSSDVLTQVSQMSPAQIYFYLPENQFFEVRQLLREKNLPLEVYHPARKDMRFKGILEFADNQIDLTTGTLLMRGDVENESLYFWPGEFVRVLIFLRTEPNAILVPSSSIQQGPKGKFVYIVTPDMIAEVRDINVIAQFNSETAVVDHLTEEDRVVTQGQLNIKPGGKVTIQNQPQQQETKEP